MMTAASFTWPSSRLLIRIAFYGELYAAAAAGRGGNNQNAGIIMLALMAVSIVVYAVSFLLIRMLWRYRGCPRTAAALLTGQPSALKSALVKVTGHMADPHPGPACSSR